VTAFAASPTDTQVRVTIPAALQNGIYDVRVVLASPGNSATNSRKLEVIPLLASPIGLAVVTVAGTQVHQLTLNGARLSGTDVRVAIDGDTYFAGSNATVDKLVFTLGRLLSSGPHTVRVIVNGSASHSVDLGVA
jgi:hypothetical protein